MAQQAKALVMLKERTDSYKLFSDSTCEHTCVHMHTYKYFNFIKKCVLRLNVGGVECGHTLPTSILKEITSKTGINVLHSILQELRAQETVLCQILYKQNRSVSSS